MYTLFIFTVDNIFHTLPRSYYGGYGLQAAGRLSEVYIFLTT